MRFQITCFAAVGKAMTIDPAFWRARPLPQQALQYASTDVMNLLSLAARQKALLALAASRITAMLSMASSQLNWLFADRTIRCDLYLLTAAAQSALLFGCRVEHALAQVLHMLGAA